MQVFLANLSNNFQLRDVKVLPPPESSTPAVLPLISPDNSVIGELSWEPELPGDQILPVLLLGIFGVAILMAGNAFVFLRRAREIAIQLSQARIEADDANAEKSEFLAKMSHELRTPLNAILGFSETISMEIFGPLGSEKYRTYAEHVHDAGLYLLNLINDILDLSKIESGLMILKEEEVELNKLIEYTVKLIDTQAIQKKLDLKVELDQNIPIITSNQRAIQQIILNILTNAVKFTSQGGVITCTSSVTTDGSIILTITDTGIGIIESDLQKIMQPFGQSASAYTNEREGTGLGLPIAKHLTELLGGTFKLESEFGIGTNVTVSLPANFNQIRELEP